MKTVQLLIRRSLVRAQVEEPSCKPVGCGVPALPGFTGIYLVPFVVPPAGAPWPTRPTACLSDAGDYNAPRGAKWCHLTGLVPYWPALPVQQPSLVKQLDDLLQAVEVREFWKARLDLPPPYRPHGTDLRTALNCHSEASHRAYGLLHNLRKALP